MNQKSWFAGAVALVVAILTILAGVVVLSSANDASSSDQKSSVSTMRVERGRLSAVVSLDGTLTYSAQADGSPYSAINQAKGTYTELPDAGDKIGCGDVFYRVDDKPALLLCGTVPAYRDLRGGDKGDDVRQLNRNLHELGYDTGAGIDPSDDDFTGQTAGALEKLQRDIDVDATGTLKTGDVIFLPKPARISKVTAKLGGSAQPGSQVAQATSDTLDVQASLDASQQGEVRVGDRARITLPGNRTASGKVTRLGRVAQTTSKDDKDVGAATIPAYIRINDPKQARGLDQAPVGVDISTKGVKRALSVPVSAIVGKSGGGYAVEVVHDDGRRGLVAVQLGLFDTTGGRVQVQGALHEGDRVVVPSP